jgi:hypothetical protein
MADGNKPVLSKNGKLTTTSDKEGIVINICNPGWFDEREKFKIANAPVRTASLEFGGADLNFAARILYAEASGSAQLPDQTERDKEKLAILNVMHFRLGRTGYRTTPSISKTFQEVCEGRGQFESFFAKKPKFVNSSRDKSIFQSLQKKECADLAESLNAVRNFLNNGPDHENYFFDGFLGYKADASGVYIGKTRFFLSEHGKTEYAKNN